MSDAPWDAISIEVMWQRLQSCADQAAAALLRTSFSTVVAASHDFRFVITDADGNSLAQSYYGEVMFVTTFPDCVRNVLAAIGRDELRPGDVIITNDPWLAAGHLPDVHLMTPVFQGGELVGFAGSVIHLSDIGGRFGPHDASEVFEEGLCIPPMKLFDGGRPNRDLFAIIRANVRVWDLAYGDLLAQVSANAVGVRLVQEFMAEYELAELTTLSGVLQSRVELAMRREIARLPDGSYPSETFAEIGHGIPDARIHSTLTVHGDEITVDYTESDPQTELAGVNCVLNCTRSLTLYPLHALLLPAVPAIEGAARPIHVIAPPGSIMNAVRPAAVDVRAMITHLLPDHIMRALAPVIPDRVTAGNGIRWMMLADKTDETGRRSMTSFFQAGGLGASRRRPGPHAKFFPIKAWHTPIERFESDTGLLIRRRALRTGSGGPGTTSGGQGQVIELENPTRTPARFTFYRPLVNRGAAGLFGGGDGAPGRVLLNDQPLDEAVLTVAPGDRVRLETPGGGGFGAGAGAGEGAGEAGTADQ